MKISTYLFLLCFTIQSYGQKSDLGNWINYFGNKQINSQWNWHHEAQFRNYDALGDLEQLLLRTGIGRNLTEDNNNLLLGYGFIISENYITDNLEKVGINEHRIYQQFITKQKLGIVSLQHRYRFEQRFVAGDFKTRLRYFLSMNVPLTRKEITDNTLYLSAYNEIFINPKNSVFDRNRLYGALGYKFNKQVKVELGYMNQFFKNGGRDQINMNTFVNF
ncbi:MAG: hypothetical protein ACI9IP_001762 [Arcticibacterium sp.]|jgi:hypothetical protein